MFLLVLIFPVDFSSSNVIDRLCYIFETECLFQNIIFLVEFSQKLLQSSHLYGDPDKLLHLSATHHFHLAVRNQQPIYQSLCFQGAIIVFWIDKLLFYFMNRAFIYLKYM